jgi:hypothetical protein
VIFAPEALNMLVAETQGYPFFIQLYGFHTWEAARPTPQKKLISVRDVETGISTAQIDIDALYVARFASATKAEREFITALARIAGAGAVKRAAIADELGKTTQGISDVRSRLIDKAIITEVERGFVQFTLPGFAEYVLNES